MKYLYTTFTTIIAVGMFMTASPVLAQTPDGMTPADEGVCDELKMDGVTKGLYGLCVAFCESQDVVDESTPLTEAELEELLTANPANARLLTNYDRKKQAGDPDMPCVVIQNDCPCWTYEEMYSIDGVMPDGGAADMIRCNTTNTTSLILENRNSGSGQIHFARVLADSSQCIYQRWENHDPADFGVRVIRNIDGLSNESYTACRDQILLQATILCPAP